MYLAGGSSVYITSITPGLYMTVPGSAAASSSGVVGGGGRGTSPGMASARHDTQVQGSETGRGRSVPATAGGGRVGKAVGAAGSWGKGGGRSACVGGGEVCV